MSLWTPETLQALLGLVSVMATFLFTIYLKKYGDERGKRREAEDQGDLLLDGAKAMFGTAVVLHSHNARARPHLINARILLDALEAAWNDAKAPTPALQAIYDELALELQELGTVVTEGQ